MKRKKNLERAIVLGLILSASLYGTVWAEEIIGNNDGGEIQINSKNEDAIVYGWQEKEFGEEVNIRDCIGKVTVSGEGVVSGVTGGEAYSVHDHDNNIDSKDVYIKGGYAEVSNGGIVANDGSGSSGSVNGNHAYSWDGNATALDGEVYINNGIVGNGQATTYGINGSFAQSEEMTAIAKNGKVTIAGNSVINFSAVPNNTYRGIIGSQALTNEWGTENKIANAYAENGNVTITGGTIDGETYVLGNLAYANGYRQGNAYAKNGNITINEVTGKTVINNSVRGSYVRSSSGDAYAQDSTVTVESGSVNGDIYGGYAINTGNGNQNTIVETSGNIVNVSGGTTSNIIAGYVGSFASAGKSLKVQDNNIILTGDSTVNGSVIGGYFRLPNFSDVKSIIKDNTIILSDNVDLKQADLYGAYIEAKIDADDVYEYSGNDLIVDGWKGKQVNSLNNFNNIKFQNIEWENEGVVIDVLNNNATSSLENTNIDFRDSTTLAGGTTLNVNDYMYFVKTDNGNLGTKAENILVNQNGNGDNIFTAGVAFEGTGEVEVEENGNVKYTIKDVKTTDQTDSVGEGSSIAAAFLVTGGDLVVEGLNAMEQDQLFGTKTFAIVEGHDSTFDVADDVKVNGWNGLYGVGNIKELDDGNLSYAAFFENGIANYRTYNSFLGETFRGDGTIVYNGGGLAGRYKKDNGVYAEASLRAGLLKNDMENIFRDGNGIAHSYKTETPYYALHLGIGKYIPVNESTDWDLYTRFYHTYNDGDEFTVAGDKFDVDSITSDRLRIGARYITNKHNKWGTYYGAAWEYEFNGDADVSVNGTSLDTESLQGSSYFAEIGFNYQKDKTSPWAFEGRMRGYTGVREGISGILRATYSF